ncbi:magnesium transporter CorA family protein [Mesoterricola sediminis]|uniref:Magnesium transport protein CorA n=1 Tax=Mesoterricola sediminis TaxID=2927980 RepID=A0AA48KDT2_9BACT|nr:magnesium transporter CorA family protein [Mesoterricola sediminis]BDU78531.1 magnesium transport protein CorA [Mesoterricola sediminis]
MSLRAWLLTPRGTDPLPDPAALPRLLGEGVPVWLDLTLPDVPDLGPLRACLPGHPLNWEDAGKPGQRPKLEDHGDHLFLIVRSLDTREKRLARQLQTLQVACFLTPRLLVTIRSGPLEVLDQVAARFASGQSPVPPGPDAVLHGLLDGIVDAFAPHLEQWELEVERLDQEALRDPRTPVLERILSIRKLMVRLRRLAAGQADLVLHLAKGREGMVQPEVRPYFQDVHDHLMNVLEGADSLRDSVTIAVDIYLNSVNNRLNEIMKILTVMSSIMLPLGLVTGVFGMNFLRMPGLQHPAGFWWTLAGMGLLTAGLLLAFRRYRLL